MPMYTTTTDPVILYENDGFKICKYRAGVNWTGIWHWCKNRSIPEEVFRVGTFYDGYRCTHCSEECPDDVITIWVLMGGKPAQKYFNEVHFTGLTTFAETKDD